VATVGAATNGRPRATRTSELVRFATAGSVDDGKSTLIGRLLYDTKSIFEDQLEHVEETSKRRGDGYVNLALLTDGLRAEREQGITIDVAYRYFHTPRRKFIIADTPGHEQYTRNMVTGASTADLALVLVDARKGVLEQSRRHAFIASLLRIPHLVVCVNKMDLVDWDQEVFERICSDFTGWAAKLDVQDVTFIPISALHGDNVVDRSANMAWYQGSSLLYHLEHVHVASDRNLQDARFPVQWVTRPMSDALHDYRGYAGEVASGVFRAGDEVVVLPSGRTSRIAGIDTFDGELDEAYPPMSVTLRLEDDIDVSRGDLICRPQNRPVEAKELDAMVCWMSERPLAPGGRYRIKHTSRGALAKVDQVKYRIDVNSLHRDESAEALELNEIGKLRLRLSTPLLVDQYRRNRTTGSFVLIDESTNDTVGAGMVL
jgi:bifunctional enzyme CysN/CysC